MKQSRLALILVAALALTTGPLLNLHTTTARAGSTSMLDTIRKNGVIRIGVAADPPYTLQDKSGHWYSFVPSIDMMLAKALGVKAQFVPTTWTVIVAGLQANKYDIIGTSIYDTPEREKAIAFSVPYSYGGTSYVGLKETMRRFKSVKDLNNPKVTIALITGTAEDQVTRRLFPKAQIKAFPNTTTAFLVQEVESRHEPVFATSSFALFSLHKQYPNLGFLPDDYKGIDPKGICIGLPKGDPIFKAYLDGFIGALWQTGTIKRLQDQWLANAT